MRAATDLSTADSIQLLEDRKSTSDLRSLLREALDFAAGAGSEPTLDLLINSSTHARYTMLATPLAVAARALQNGTTRLLLRRTFFGKRLFQELHLILRNLAPGADPKSFHSITFQARLNIAKTLLDAGAELDGCLLEVLRNYKQCCRTGLILLLIARGACLRRRELKSVRKIVRDAETLHLVEELQIPVWDSPDGSDCSVASIEAKYVQFGRGGQDRWQVT